MLKRIWNNLLNSRFLCLVFKHKSYIGHCVQDVDYRRKDIEFCECKRCKVLFRKE